MAKERKFVEPDGTLWWQVELGSPENAPMRAWVREKEHAGTRWETPHAWPGFTVIDGTLATPENAFRRHVCITGRVRPEEEEEFQASASELSQSEFIRGIEAAIDKAGTLDGKVTGADLGKARSSYWLSHALSRLIVRFESQWSEDMSRWRCLDQVMHPDWLVEMRRQEKRAWWGAMATALEGFPSDARVHHIHPFGWVDNFSKITRRINVEIFLELYVQIHARLGVYEENNDKESVLVQTRPPNAKTIDNLRKLMILLLTLYDEINEEPNLSHLAYMITTARHESYDWIHATFFGPISEKIENDRAEVRYGSGPTARNPARARLNGNTDVGDGFRFRGRGLAQITWKINYRKFSSSLGIDLVSDPDLALRWDVAARILFFGMRNGTFRRDKLSDHTHGTTMDYVAARNIINGDIDTVGVLIATFAAPIEECLRASII